MAPSYIIDHATREDIPHILAMIHELAAYENAASSVEATNDSLASTLCFAPTPGAPPSGTGYAKTLLIRIPSSTTLPPSNPNHSYADGPVRDTEVVGMAMYFNNYSTWRSAPGVYLEDLYVRPEYRKRGYGKLLIQGLAKETVRINGKRLEWSCLKWNEPSLAFYRSLGAKEMLDWVSLRVDGEALEKLGASV